MRCDVPGAWCGVRGAWYEVRGARYEAQDTRYVVRGTWYTCWVCQEVTCKDRNNVPNMGASWVRTPLPEGELVGAANALCFEFTQKWNEPCFVNTRMLTLCSRQAGQSPPGKVGCQGLDTPCTANISHANSSQIWCLCPFWHAQRVYVVHGTWYEVWGARYEVRGAWYEVRGARHEVRGAKHFV
jgi:hypothetical protein